MGGALDIPSQCGWYYWWYKIRIVKEKLLEKTKMRYTMKLNPIQKSILIQLIGILFNL